MREVGCIGHLVFRVAFVSFAIQGNIEHDRVGRGKRRGVFDVVRNLNIRIRVDELGNPRTVIPLVTYF